MNLQLDMPQDFTDELKKHINIVYTEAIQTARRDVGVSREYLTIEEVCELMNISRNTLTNNYIEQGLPRYKIGNRQYIKKTELNKFIEMHQI